MKGQKMNKIMMTVIGSSVLAAFIAVGANATAFIGQEYSREAKISLTQARHIALKVYRGKIISVELEREKGGSGLRYSFDIRRHGSTHEVGVDAVTGKVLENSVEGPNAD